MKNTCSVIQNTLSHASSIILALFMCSQLYAGDPPEGFTSLFNGTDLSGWHGNNPHDTAKAADRQASLDSQAAEFKKYWKVENGEMVNTGEGPYATTDKEYGDMELLIDFKLVPGADSGIYLRGNPQVQIWDTTDQKKWRYGAQKGSGGLWNNPGQLGGKMPLVHADHSVGEWNHMRIRQLGSRTWVWLNDQLVVDGVLMANYFTKRKTPLPAKGPIHLQTHGGEMRWRNIFIREIEPEEANTLLSERDTEGFESIFNGKDFAGWQGAVDEYEVVDGAITSKGGGNMFTAETYSDFVFKLDFKVPPGGNNGLAIRYPGTGNPAYNGMCELQVLDNTAEQYADLDSRQYHGSVYGKAAAARGYLRPVHTWNHQVVRVKGSTVQVELNGTVIVDADLSTLTEFMKGNFKQDIPDDGHLGFAGHGKGIAFRNLWVLDRSVSTHK
jgi:hypothetical protein